MAEGLVSLRTKCSLFIELQLVWECAFQTLPGANRHRNLLKKIIINDTKAWGGEAGEGREKEPAPPDLLSCLFGDSKMSRKKKRQKEKEKEAGAVAEEERWWCSSCSLATLTSSRASCPAGSFEVDWLDVSPVHQACGCSGDGRLQMPSLASLCFCLANAAR